MQAMQPFERMHLCSHPCPEAEELARHADVRMTMKYTHIGIDDQAKAVANLLTRWQGYQRLRGAFGGTE
jgi:hypothetical protein